MLVLFFGFENILSDAISLKLDGVTKRYVQRHHLCFSQFCNVIFSIFLTPHQTDSASRSAYQRTFVQVKADKRS